MCGRHRGSRARARHSAMRRPSVEILRATQQVRKIILKTIALYRHADDARRVVRQQIAILFNKCAENMNIKCLLESPRTRCILKPFSIE
jgi:hypothetical protein